MPVYALGPLEPVVHPDAFVHPEAVLIGEVEVGAHSTIWPGAVLRGDSGPIRIGARTSVQDGSVLHSATGLETVVGDRCTIGHIVHLEGCTVEDDALVGNGSVVLHRAVVRSWSLVGSNAVVPEGMEVPGGTMALGVPARIRDKAPDRETIVGAAEFYVERGRRYRAEMRRLDP